MNEERTALSNVFELIEQYVESDRENNDKPVVRYLPADALKKQIDLDISADGATYEDLVRDIEKYLHYSVDTSHKQFFNQLFGGRNFPAFLGEIITALTNTSMYTYEVAPVATLIEMALIKKLNELVGFENGDGTFLTGGSNANLIAMFSARNKVCPEIKAEGAFGSKRLIAYVSEQCHYSFDTAANVLGIGSNQVRKIPVDANGCMLVDELDAAIVRSAREGDTPFFIAATAGTTMLGAYDPIDAIAVVARKHDLWLHVDGAFGGSMILSPSHRRLLKGLDQADSFTMDPHKLMNIPLMCSVLLVKEKGRLLRNLTDLDTEYLYHDDDTQCYDLGKSSIQCGRRVDALKLWLAWRFFGDNGYAARMDKLVDLARYAREKVETHPRLTLMAPPQSVAVCFRYDNTNGVDVNAFNLQLRESMRKSGKTLVNYGYLNKAVAIRFIAANPDADNKDVDTFFDHVLITAEQLEKGA